MKETKISEQLPLNAEIQRAQEAMPQTVSVNPHFLIQKAIESGNIDAVERMVALTERLQAKWARDRFFDALSAFQAECPEIVKRQQAGSGNYQYRYAPLPVIVAAVKELLKNHGFSWTVTPGQADEKSVTAHCHLHHKDGHMETTSVTVPIDFEGRMNASQKVGSAITYATRYAFCGATGIMTAQGDDDGRQGVDQEEKGAKEGEVETIVGEVPQMYWKADRGSAKQQMILTEKYGPAKRYEVRKIEDASAPKGHVWRVVKIDSDMTGVLSESIKDREATTPKGEGETDFHKEREKALPVMAEFLKTNLEAGTLLDTEVAEAKKKWNSAKSVEDLAAIRAEYKGIADNRALEKI